LGIVGTAEPVYKGWDCCLHVHCRTVPVVRR